jgi:hypothetical protein
MTIGMDDPSLAPQLAETGLDADRTVPMLPWSGEQPLPGDLASPPVALPEQPRQQAAVPEQAAIDEAVSDEADDQVEAPSDLSRNPAREWRVTLLFGTAGAAAGYYASTVWKLDMWQATAGMAGAWLLLAWIWVRWVARRH